MRIIFHYERNLSVFHCRTIAMHLPTHTFVCTILTSRTREAARTATRFKARDGHSDESRFRSLISCISNERAHPGSTWTWNTLPCCVVRAHASHTPRTNIYVISVYVASSRAVSFDIGAFVLVLLTLICNGHVAISGWTDMMPAEIVGMINRGGTNTHVRPDLISNSEHEIHDSVTTKENVNRNDRRKR